MIKLIVFCTKVIIITVIAVMFSSCNSNIMSGLKGTGNVQVEKREIAEKFTKIEVSRGLEVVLEQSENVAIEVEADQNLLKHIITRVEKGTLIITSDENIVSSKTEIIRIKMPTIEGLSTTSGSNISTKNTLKGKNLTVSSTSGSEIVGTIEYDSTSIESTSGSTVTLSGKSLQLNTSATSGSSIKTGKLLSNDVIANATSGSSTDVKPLVSLKAKSTSGSSIDYIGEPKALNKEETSGGSVSKK